MARRPTHEFSHVIVAVGIVPNPENIGLEELKIEPDKRYHIKVDAYGRTNVPGVWAIGDCTDGPWLAHKASHEGVTAAEAIAQELGNAEVHPHPLDRRNIPGCTYCHPQIAIRRPDRGEGQGSRLRGQGRHVPVHRQRQGDCAGRGGGLRQNRVRRQDRRTARRAYDRRGSDRD